MSFFWFLEFGGGAKIFGKSLDTIKAGVLIAIKRKYGSGTWLRNWPSRLNTNFTGTA
jgi:hypothetical protein